MAATSPRRGSAAVESLAFDAPTADPSPKRVVVSFEDAHDGSTHAFARRAAAGRELSITVVRRGTLLVTDSEPIPPGDDRAGGDWSTPLSVIAVTDEALGELFGATPVQASAAGSLIVARATAARLSMAVGDRVPVLALNGSDESPLTLTVAGIVDAFTNLDAELVMSNTTADAVGIRRPWRVAAWGRDLAGFAEALDAHGAHHLELSTDQPEVDTALSDAEWKSTAGEFRVDTVAFLAGQLRIDPSWLRENVVVDEYPIIGRFACHRVMTAALRAALAEIESAGLAHLIDVRDTRRAGGCYSNRMIRTQEGDQGATISRHAWAATIDLNPSTNSFGASPEIDRSVVEVFRRNGFAWGGSFPTPDGMHFEYVGSPRVTGAPLAPASTTTSTTSTSTSSTTSTSTTSTPTSSISSTSATIRTTSPPTSPTTSTSATTAAMSDSPSATTSNSVTTASSPGVDAPSTTQSPTPAPATADSAATAGPLVPTATT